jgi:RimJ/RimL family protein N-acetyltransferase
VKWITSLVRQFDSLVEEQGRVELRRAGATIDAVRGILKVVRAWRPSDARLMHDAVSTSVEHLRPWLPWIAQEPRTLAARVEYLRGVRALFDRDEDYSVGVFDREERRLLGGSGLHKRVGPDALEIGYWIRADSLRQGLCSELVALLTHVALTRCGAQRVEIHCDPNNAASHAIPAKLGYSLDAVLRRRGTTPLGAARDTSVWSLFADELSTSPCASVRYSAFDACDDPRP